MTNIKAASIRLHGWIGKAILSFWMYYDETLMLKMFEMTDRWIDGSGPKMRI